MPKTLKHLSALFVITCSVFLASCGGGGGGGNTTATAITYPLQAAWIQNLNTASSLNFTLSGTSNTYTATGSGVDASAALVAGTFRGSACQKTVETVTGTATVNSTTVSLNQTLTAYYDSNYTYLGEISSSQFLIVDNGSWNLPATVAVGSSGTVYTGKRYRDSTFTTQIGTETGTFSISNDTVANSALLTVVTVDYDLTGATTSTSTNLYHLYTNGTTKLISGNTVNGNTNLTLTYQ